MQQQAPDLHDVPETMLWTLHNRASETLRPDGILQDNAAQKIYQSIDYDYERSFGVADGSHAQRSLIFDRELTEFLQQHPDGVIVNLGEGLETQRFRLDSPESLWFSVDVADAIAIRERFIQADTRHQHLAISALDPRWMEKIPTDRPLYITAQGLFMYFEAADLERLLKKMAQRFPGAWLTFDHIPRWLSDKTVSSKGWKKTKYYTTPPCRGGLIGMK